LPFIVPQSVEKAPEGEPGVSIERDESLNLSGARTVALGGHEWTVAPLSLRQILAIADHVPKLSAISEASLSGERLAPLAEVLWHACAAPIRG
jgi:hypothetical protein